MNFKSALTRLYTPLAVQEEKDSKVLAEQQEKEFAQQEMESQLNIWNAMPATKQFINYLQACHNSLINRAKDLALEGVHDTSNLLIQATTIEKVIKYARNNRESIIPDTTASRK